jgi:hypothetical protein
MNRDYMKTDNEQQSIICQLKINDKMRSREAGCNCTPRINATVSLYQDLKTDQDVL